MSQHWVKMTLSQIMHISSGRILPERQQPLLFGGGGLPEGLLYILPTECIHVFRMVLTINSDCFPKQH
jgi:hypothetical protein